MRIKKIISRLRRDFTALYECDHCGHTFENYGYDDANFHKNVIPDMICPSCNQKGNKEEYLPLATKYPSSMTL